MKRKTPKETEESPKKQPSECGFLVCSVPPVTEMHLVIDGYNLLHAGRSVTNASSNELQRERERLIDRLSTYQRMRGCGLTVVFDGWQEGWGTETREKKRGVEVIFSKLGEKADEVIKRLAREKGSGTVVITSDREVARFVQRMDVAVVSSEQFRERLEMTSFRLTDGSPEEEENGTKKKGPARRLSKKEKKTRAASKKL